MSKLLVVAGARPNFMKISPILREMEKHSDQIQSLLVHTGQHYDHSMSDSFFKDLSIKEPDFNLEVGSGSHAVQTANIMMKFEEICLQENPDLVLVVGDVNSTIATGLVAKKQHIGLAHVEAGLRSRDRTMPEEINRLATDAITDIFFTTEKEGTDNLIAEGHSASSVHFVGHVMIDNLFYQLSKMGSTPPSDMAMKTKEMLPQKYICMTLHRPSNVDNEDTLSKLVAAAKSLSDKAPVLFPCHPRTRKKIELFGLISQFTPLVLVHGRVDSGLFITEPLGYNDFLYLWKDASLMLTDSGGLQEETTALRIPCITMRENTERPITTEIGSNIVVGTDGRKIVSLGEDAIQGKWKKSKIPDLWDGKASERIVEILLKNKSSTGMLRKAEGI